MASLVVQLRPLFIAVPSHLTCHSCQKVGRISPNCPDRALLAAPAQCHVLAAQALPTPYAPLGTPNATGALPNAMSEEQACLIAQNIFNSLDSSPPEPASSPPAYAAAPALCVTNTSPLSPQVLAALGVDLSKVVANGGITHFGTCQGP